MKESLLSLENIGNKKKAHFKGKYLESILLDSSIFFRLPQQLICRLLKYKLGQAESLINSLHLKKKFFKIGLLV
jgi:hypothetical protein